MKTNKKKILSIASMICAALILIGLLSFAGPCPVEEGMKPMKCTWTAEAIKGLAVVMLISGVGKLLFKKEDMIRGTAFADVLLTLYGLAVSTFLIGTCGHAEMICNVVMKPFILLILGIYGVLGIINFMDKKKN